jgi:two-component system LytT family sensor kinase
MIAPLLFLHFVKKAFKHGTDFISVKLTVMEKKLVFSVTNAVTPGPASQPGGLGIANVRKRLELLNPDRHRLEIIHGESRFNVNLYIELP